MKEIPLTRGLVAIVDDEDFDELSALKWCATKAGYAMRCSNWRTNEFEYMHRRILSAPPGLEVDHINRDKLDNRRGNLRIVTSSQNKANHDTHANNKCGFKGVYRHKFGKWHARIKSCGKMISLGYFDSLIDAAKAYNDGALKYYGEHAKLNVIPEAA